VPTPTPFTVVDGKPIADLYDFAAIDSYALGTPAVAEASIASLSAYLTMPAKDDVEKARAIYRWITENISYDVVAFLSGNYGDQTAEGVLASRWGVCEGYARLFEALARHAGLEVVTIGGWAKGFTFVLGDLAQEKNHAWNAIRIGGGWYLLDSTWGSGSINEEQRFVREFNDYYFLVPPEQLIYTHFPEDPFWQLLSPPISRSEFASLPRVWPRFFQNGIGLISHTEGTIQVSQDVAIALSAPEDVLLIADLMQDGEELPETLTSVRRDGPNYQVRAVFPAPGEYVLTIYSKRRAEEGLYHSTLEYTVHVSEGAPGHGGFAKTYPAFEKYGLELVSHTEGTIQVSDQITIILSAPSDVLLMAGLERDGEELPDTLTFVQREGDRYEVDAVFPQAGEYDLTVFAKRKDEEGLYTSAVTYTIVASQGQPAAAGFPKAFLAFYERGVYLYAPKAGHLEPGTSQAFKLTVPAAEEVAVIVGDDWYQLQKQGDLFQGDAAIAEGEIQVCAKFPGETLYSCVLRYTAP